MTESAKQRQVNAIAAAKECLRLSGEAFSRTGAQAACAYALQGILYTQIELIEGQWDAPCDCFAGMPDPEPLPKIMFGDVDEP